MGSSSSTSHAHNYSLVHACSGAFTERTKRKGRQLFEGGQVSVEGADADTALIIVRDQRPKPYVVAVNFEEADSRDRVRIECGCKYFKSGFCCEHAYGALMAIEHNQLSLIPHDALHRRLDVIPFKSGLNEDDDWFFEGDDAFEKAGELAEKFFGKRNQGNESRWRKQMASLRRALIDLPDPVANLAHGVGPLTYWVDGERSEALGRMVVEYLDDGEVLLLKDRDLSRLRDPEDQKTISLLLTCAAAGPKEGEEVSSARIIPVGLYPAILQQLCATGRLYLRGEGEGPAAPLTLAKDEGWTIEGHVERVEQEWVLSSRLVQTKTQTIKPLDDLQMVIRDGLTVIGDKLYPLLNAQAFDWVRYLRKEAAIGFSTTEAEALLTDVGQLPSLPQLSFSDELPWKVSRPQPEPHIHIVEERKRDRSCAAIVSFRYDGELFGFNDEKQALLKKEEQIVIQRSPQLERGMLTRLGDMGAQFDEDSQIVLPGDPMTLARKLAEAGWQVELPSGFLRMPDSRKIALTTGQDWFDLDGDFKFGDISVPLPEILKAVRKKQQIIDLEDGTQGMIPTDWLRQLSVVSGLSTTQGDKIRFRKSQTLILDWLLSGQDGISYDSAFEKARHELGEVSKPHKVEEPEGFGGTLRGYQQEGLGWLSFLHRAGLNGCLADDMGLGKTIQVLALLDRLRKEDGGLPRPSLVVAPRSLIYNWLQEIERFTPKLKVVDYTGSQRSELLENLEQTHLVVTTYGTVRRDIDILREKDFYYLILDEAQAIKNPGAQVSKACRLLNAEHRLAVSGTPVENDVVELCSIFEFLNPRMLGSQRNFVSLLKGQQESLPRIAKALRPLILRRSKSEVLEELPPKTELTIHVELRDEERKLYNDLRDHYREAIGQGVSNKSWPQSKFQVLEALLRLRQMACHSGLVNAERKSGSSSKIETVLQHIQEVTSEGHKVLVFSQFVELLTILRKRLEQEEIKYAYLDGQTRNRPEVIEEFQGSEDCGVFLISLRAGGLGLNLTAADYVFILDPWWNPAVEAQAIDRAHRLGQTRPVFAYRYITKDTVEEKIVELHRDKRALAEALLEQKESLLKSLSLDELYHLLS